MAKLFYFMKPDLVSKFADTKDQLIQARKEMSASEVEKAKADILHECNINEIKKDGSVDYRIENGIAIIPINGFLTDYVDICMAWFDSSVTTYGFIRQCIVESNNNDQVKAILLDNNSGGGFVTECEETFQVILNSEKPVYSMVHDMACSADYWLSSASKEIISVSKTGFFGSIGVAMEIMNYDDQEKKEGIKRIVLTNNESKKKRPNELTKAGQQVYIDELNALYNVFADSIIIKRKKKLTREKIDNLEGIVLISQDAIDYGLADKYMLQTEVIPYIEDKVKNKSTSFVVNKNTPVKGKTEDTKMTLKEFLAENPDSKIELDKMLGENYDKGVLDGKEDVQNRINKIAPIMSSDKYDSALKAQGQKALTGEISIESFQAVVSIEDMRIEREKSNKASDDTNDSGDTQSDNNVNDISVENQAAQDKLKEIARSV